LTKTLQKQQRKTGLNLLFKTASYSHIAKNSSHV